MAVFGLSTELHERIALQLFEAERTNTPLSLLTKEYPVITYGDAYAIQQAGLRLREAEGARVIGRKIGITSKGMMQQLDCTSPDYGYLLDTTLIPEGGSCVRAELNLPLIEGELAFVIGKDMNINFVTEDDVRKSTAQVMPCFEVVDTHFESWTITVRDTICDNAAAARFMLGTEPKQLSEINPATISLTIEKNGNVIGSATGAEIMESSPLASVTWLANRLLEHGDYLKEGDIVLSGAFMAADAAEAGDVYMLTMEGFPPISLSFT